MSNVAPKHPKQYVTPVRLPGDRMVRLMKEIDRVCHHFQVHSRVGGRAWYQQPKDGVKRWYHPHAHHWVRVYLLRRMGAPWSRIQRAYGIDPRTARNWERQGRGRAAVEDAVKEGRLDYRQIACSLLLDF